MSSTHLEGQKDLEGSITFIKYKIDHLQRFYIYHYGQEPDGWVMFLSECGILIIFFLSCPQSIRILQEELLQLEISTFVLVCRIIISSCYSEGAQNPEHVHFLL